MNRLKQRGVFAIGVEVGTGCNTNRACASWAQVAQNVTEQIAGHHHIKKVGTLHKMRCQNINVKLVNMDARIVLGHFHNSLIPVRHGDGNTIGFGGTGEMLLGAGLGQFKGEFQDAINTNARHDGLLHHNFTLCARVHAPANAGVLTLGVFAHDVHVNFTGLPGRAVSSHHGCNDARHEPGWTQVDVLIKLTAEQKQRTPQRHMVGNFVWPTHSAKVDGIVAADLVFPIVGQHLAVLFKVVPT